jgi:hypothetical protein
MSLGCADPVGQAANSVAQCLLGVDAVLANPARQLQQYIAIHDIVRQGAIPWNRGTANSGFVLPS